MEGIHVAQALGKYSGRKVGAVQSDEKLGTASNNSEEIERINNS
jgi:hypothetical protein